MTPEGRTKDTIRRMLEEAGAYFFMPPANGYGRAGIPDFVACINARFVAIEAKAGKGKTTLLQGRELQRIKSAGGYALVVYDEPDHYEMLASLLAKLKGTMRDT